MSKKDTSTGQAQQPNSKPTELVILFGGYLHDKDGSPPELDAAKLAEKHGATIIGDGKAVPKMSAVADQLGNMKGPVELVVVGHSHQFTQANGQPSDRLSMLFDSERQRTSNEKPAAFTPDGTPVQPSHVMPAAEFFGKLPDNVRSVYLASCQSEAAMKDVGHAPEGTRVYWAATAAEDSVSPVGSAAIMNILAAKPDEQGLRIPAAAGGDIPATAGPNALKDRQTPPVTSYAIGGRSDTTIREERVIDLDRGLKDAVGKQHRFSGSVREEVTKGLSSGVGVHETAYRMGSGIDQEKLRSLVHGTTSDVGRGKLPSDEFKNIAKEGQDPIHVSPRDVGRYLVDAEIRDLAKKTDVPVEKAAGMFSACMTQVSGGGYAVCEAKDYETPTASNTPVPERSPSEKDAPSQAH